MFGSDCVSVCLCVQVWLENRIVVVVALAPLQPPPPPGWNVMGRGVGGGGCL